MGCPCNQCLVGLSLLEVPPPAAKGDTEGASPLRFHP